MIYEALRHIKTGTFVFAIRYHCITMISTTEAWAHGLPAATGAVPDAAGALRQPGETSCHQLPGTSDAWRQGDGSRWHMALLVEDATFLQK